MHEPPDLAQFAAFFDDFLKRQGLSGAQAARRLRVAQSQVSRWRRGEGGIRLENLQRIHEVFGLDLGYLRRLAGLPASGTFIEQETIAPELAALADAERADFLSELQGFPPSFWEAILFTQKAGRRLAVDVARKAMELTQPAQPTISTPASSELAPPERRRVRDRRKGDNPGSEPLARLFALAGAH